MFWTTSANLKNYCFVYFATLVKRENAKKGDGNMDPKLYHLWSVHMRTECACTSIALPGWAWHMALLLTVSLLQDRLRIHQKSCQDLSSANAVSKWDYWAINLLHLEGNEKNKKLIGINSWMFNSSKQAGLIFGIIGKIIDYIARISNSFLAPHAANIMTECIIFDSN